MPFTTSHPAIVIPLKKLFPRWFSLSGLIAGAMAPDLVYFLAMTTELRGYSHSWSGLFYLSLPLGIAFCFGFHYYFKYEFIRHLPAPLDRYFAGLANSKWSVKNWSVLIISVLIGGLSHFGWDSFTHPAGQMVRMFPVLNESISFLGTERKICRVLQHASTLGGFLLILYYIIYGNIIPTTNQTVSKINTIGKLKYWLKCSMFTLCLMTVAVVFYDWFFKWGIFAGHNFFMAFMTVGLASFAGIFWWAVINGFMKKK